MRPHPSLLALVAILCAACPQKRGGGGPAAQPGPGCPSASAVYLASYLTPGQGTEQGGGQGSEQGKRSAPEARSEGHTGWVLPLHDKVEGSIEGVPDYQSIDAAAAGAAGVPAPPKVAWLLAPGGPCKATIGGYYAAAVDGPPANIAYGVELTGCAAPPEGSEGSAIVLTYDGSLADAAPTDCKLVPPRPVAARLGEHDDKGTWSRPKKETPIPPAFAQVVPDRACEPPGCEKLWSIAQVDVGGKPVAWAGAVNWLLIPEGEGPDKQCSWKVDRFSGFFVAGPDGAPVKVTEAQEHPLLLTAVLADAGGAKVLIAAAPGEYTTYDLGGAQGGEQSGVQGGGGGARVGRHLVWLRPGPEAYAEVDQLGPACGM